MCCGVSGGVSVSVGVSVGDTRNTGRSFSSRRGGGGAASFQAAKATSVVVTAGTAAAGAAAAVAVRRPASPLVQPRAAGRLAVAGRGAAAQAPADFRAAAQRETTRHCEVVGEG